MPYLIAATCMIYLSRIENPLVMRTEAKELALLLLTFMIDKLDRIVAFMLVRTIG
jgi:hypothetical protein